MLSLYLHIPFCAHKCNYCSFFVVPEDEATPEKIEDLKTRYVEHLLQEIDTYSESYPTTSVKTIHIGGGTPFQLGADRLFQIIDRLLEKRDCEFLEELTIELNPDPFDQVLQFIKDAGEKYKNLYKLRFSIGIQTFDDEILEASKRNYVFNNLVWFLRELQQIRKANMSFNADFIAFGHWHQDNEGQDYLRPDHKLEFFQKFVNSKLMDGFSIYTLELFPGSVWYNQTAGISKEGPAKTHRLQKDDDAIMDEFHLLRSIIEKAGYKRYEISNFAVSGKQSIHNTIYWTMGSYLGLGINSSSFLKKNELPDSLAKNLGVGELTERQGVRFQNKSQWKGYLDGELVDPESVNVLSERDFEIEQCFLSLRTNSGIKQCSEHTEVFVDNRQELVEEWNEQGIVTYEDDTLKLTAMGFDVYNTVATELFKEL